MNITQTVAPIAESLSLADAKAFMRILENDDDLMITSMIVSAREFAENYTNRQFEEATFELISDSLYQDMIIRKDPITEIVKIEYMDDNGAYQLFTDFYTYKESGATKLYFNTFPSYKDDKRAIKITFKAGYTTVPSSIVSYIKVLVSTMYENREMYIVGVSVDKFANPMVNKILDMYRVNPL